MLTLGIILPILAQQKEIDVYLVGGQSNATGQAYVKNIPASFKIDTRVRIYYSRFLNKGEGSEQWNPLCQASETKNKFGIELSLGTKLQSLYPKRQIALIKHALSGSNLYQQWNPGNRQKNIRGEEYINFIKTVKDAIISLKQQGYRPIIKAGMEQSRQYSSNLKNFIEQIRKEFNSENMLFVYGTVIPIAASRFTGRELVRKAQFAVSNNSNSEFSINNALLIPADDLQMLYNDYQIQHLKMMYI